MLALLSAPLAAHAALTPSNLTCEYFPEPLNVDAAHPRLGWTLASDVRGDAQVAYQVLAASSLEALAKDQGDLWDSGKVASEESTQVPFGGAPLGSLQQCYWKVRVWDKAGQPSPWTAPAHWCTGLLTPQDWTAKWIAAPGAQTGSSSLLGYHAAEAQRADDAKWVQVDLGSAVPIDSVKLHSLDHEVAGFGFPVRFKITASDDPNFATSDVIADDSGKDFPNPGAAAVTLKSGAVKRRYVRVTATKLYHRAAGNKSYCFALAELEVFSGGKNVALHAPVTALDSTEGWGWGKAELTDGENLAPDPQASGAGATIKTLPIFRKSVVVSKPVSRAMLAICGLGQYELELNGSKVGNAVLEPGWSDYRKTCLYQTYDLTDRLKVGTHTLGVMLGNGMYNVANVPGRYTKFTGSMGTPKVIAQLHIAYADGTSETIATDSSWQVAGGPITLSHTYGGEDYDARLESPLPASWQPALETAGPGGKLTGASQSAPAITVAATLSTQKVTHPKPDAYVYDLGQNCAQIPSISVSGRAGAVVRLTPAEVLRPDGTVSQEPSGGPTFYTYTLRGGGGETWAPRFTYYGSRYLEVTGAVPAGAPNPGNLPVISELSGKFITSSSPIVGEFECSNGMFNRAAEIIRWAMRNNLMSVLTDCPHREKLGWLEQSHLVGPSLMYNLGIPALFTKVCGDMSDAQLPDGMVPDIAPEFAVFNGGFRDSPEWGSASVLIPWQVYEFYGDTAILARRYDTMARYVDYLSSRAKDHILSNGLGDWYDLGPNAPGYAQLTPVPLTATAFYYRDITILERASKLLGRDADAERYAKLAAEVREAFNRAFYHADAHTYATGSQTANAIPLAFGLPPEADRPAIVANLVAEIRGRDNRLTAGDVGYRYLLRTLADGGRSDVIFDMNSRSDRPGYGMIIAKGATALTEAWDGRLESSQDHFMLGHIMEWFYSDLAGIQPDPTGPGFKRILIKPTPVGNITWAKASYRSIHGTIESGWKIESGAFKLDVVVPPGCTATVALPAAFGRTVTEGGKPVASVPGVTVRPTANGTETLVVPSGTYHFESHSK
jgi:hypothetical protein